MNKHLLASACLVLATLCTTPVMADASGAVVGGAVGSAIGAVIGHDVDGRHGAIVGAAIGGATGAAIGSDSDRRSYKVEKQVVHQRPVVVEKVIYVNNRNDYRPHHVKQRVVYYKNNHQRRHHHRHHD
ncbi:MAG: hypothetical protein IPM78_13925 [Moraxellaceae bacterium]|nr:hypothetical protein [Moraxellaceae bacterium]